MKVLNQQSIKYEHLKRVYSQINNREGMSRARLARNIKLSKTTVSALVDELIGAGYVTDEGVGTSVTLGRKPNILRLNNQGNVVAVISWHKKRFVGALVDIGGNIMYQTESRYRENEDGIAQIKSLFEQQIHPEVKTARILGICIIMPAMIDEKNRHIVSTVLSLDNGATVVERLRKALPCYPLSILNDTSCYAYAEYIYSDITSKNVAFININKGVGAVLFNKGELLRGANAMATQFGHSSIDRHGAPCACGNRGCLEGLIGETALPARARECGAASIFESPEKILFKDVGQLCDVDNPLGLLLAGKLAEDLACGLSMLVSMFHPQMIIIGGIGANLGQKYLQMVTQSLHSQGFSNFVKDAEVCFTKLPESSELQGAARYFMDKHFEFDGQMENKLFLD